MSLFFLDEMFIFAKNVYFLFIFCRCPLLTRSTERSENEISVPADQRARFVRYVAKIPTPEELGRWRIGETFARRNCKSNVLFWALLLC